MGRRRSRRRNRRRRIGGSKHKQQLGRRLLHVRLAVQTANTPRYSTQLLRGFCTDEGIVLTCKTAAPPCTAKSRGRCAHPERTACSRARARCKSSAFARSSATRISISHEHGGCHLHFASLFHLPGVSELQKHVTASSFGSKIKPRDICTESNEQTQTKRR